MKLISYYLQIILPLVILFWAATLNYSAVFAIGALFYALIYRPLVDGNRLLQLGLVERKEWWKLFIPFYLNIHVKYFYELYFKL